MTRLFLVLAFLAVLLVLYVRLLRTSTGKVFGWIVSVLMAMYYMFLMFLAGWTNGAEAVRLGRVEHVNGLGYRKVETESLSRVLVAAER